MSVVAHEPQHMAALRLANETRLAQAEMRRAIRRLPMPEGRDAVAALFEDPPPAFAALTVMRALSMPARHGRQAAFRFIRHAPTLEMRRVRDLTERQRSVLAARLRGEVLV